MAVANDNVLPNSGDIFLQSIYDVTANEQTGDPKFAIDVEGQLLWLISQFRAWVPEDSSIIFLRLCSATTQIQSGIVCNTTTYNASLLVLPNKHDKYMSRTLHVRQ